MRPDGEPAVYIGRGYVERFLADCQALLEQTYQNHLKEVGI